ncbi:MULTISPECIES: hypothetical protein [Pseudanabaena]|uniref:hypothetical protein n=1 Tax=Pseudanabaena TaxID=1152 RepID=UPI0024787264|nr:MULTISPECIES: hypothetical protein [Pseudanabaena]MEA5487696.1 hypothetical protein [Pseudanabaena sp. CCNP1317]WGS70835.1 hypothetical protein OA858_13980 [Pseudanabaena galeata CCNP1313]
MLKKIPDYIFTLWYKLKLKLNFFEGIKEIRSDLIKIRESLGRIESRQNYRTHYSLLDIFHQTDFQYNEFRVFSQWGEDGIIQSLINSIEIENKIFVEFGVQNYTESNTRFLLINNNWSGLVIDNSPDNIHYIKQDQIYWKYNLKAECAFIDKDNINKLLIDCGMIGDIGLLSVDIDGNDYWVWEAINCITPRIVICEYNGLFGNYRKVTIPYDKSFSRDKAHFSCLYYGASIAALSHLAASKGYVLLGSNSAGNNLFFLRKDLVGDRSICSPETAYRKPQFRESRDISGNLSYLDFDARLTQISEMPLYDLELGALIQVKDL